MLDGAIAQATRLDAPTRARVLSQLTLARQRTAAAETLWSNNHTAEALRLSIVSLDDTLAAAAILADLAPAKEPIEVAASDVSPAAAGQEGGAASTATPESAPPASAAPPEEPWRRALRTRNVRPAKIARVTETVLASRTTALPTLDADMSQTLAELFVRATVARQAVDDAIAPVCGSLAELRWARVRRGATLLLTAIAIVVGLYLTLHVPQGTFVTASDVWAQAPSFAAEMA